MGICDNCQFLNNKKISPRGSRSPIFYIVGDIPTREDISNGLVLSSGDDANSKLLMTANAVDINDTNTRYFSSVRCNISNVGKNDIDPLRDNCSQYLKYDISSSKPKLVIALGGAVTRVLLGDKFRNITSSRGKFYNISVNGYKVKVLPVFSPNYVVNNPSSQKEFTDDFIKARMYVEGKLVDISEKELEFARTYDEFKEFYDKYLVDCPMPSFDLETNAEESHTDSARIVGFSFASDGYHGIYVVRKSLEYEMPSEDYDKIVELSKSILKAKPTLVHNCMYELPFTYNEWGIYIAPNDTDIEDSLIKARLVLGGKLGAGLKERCMSELGYPDWDYDLDVYKKSFLTLFSKWWPTPAGKSRWEYDYLADHNLIDLMREYKSYAKDKKLDKRSSQCMESLASLISKLSEYYSDSEFVDILDKIKSKIIDLIDIRYYGPFSYAFIPMKIITKYGAMDAVSTQDLNDHFDDKINQLSDKLHVDLHKGYYYMKRHYLLGAWMEINGIYWNDKIATELRQWYNDQCVLAEKEMINSPFMDDYIYQSQRGSYNDYVSTNCLDEVEHILGPIKVQKYNIVLQDGTKISKKNLIWSLGPDYIPNHKDDIVRYARSLITDYTDYKQFKWLFNPGSPKKENSDLISSITIDDRIKVAKMYYQMAMLVEDPAFDLSSYDHGSQDLFKVILDSQKYNEYVDKYNEAKSDKEEDKELVDELSDSNLFNESELEDEDSEDSSESQDNPESTSSSSSTHKMIKVSSSKVLDKFIEVLEKIHILNRDIQNIASEALTYHLTSCKEDQIIELNNYFKISGIDIDNVDTWTPNYRFFYYFRVWKKCNKLINAYIDGKKVGRGVVYKVDKKSLKSGEFFTKRKRRYDNNDDPEETCLMQSSLKVCQVASYRWSSGQHTLPTGSDIKNIYTSRFDQGCMAAPDMSQAEVRALAGLAHCDSLMDAFRSGQDIHRINASRVFGKKPEDITTAERRYSKMTTFSIIYGATAKSFAEKYLHGDYARGKMIYDGFYSAYPEIKDFMAAKQEEMKKHGWVTSETMGMFVYCSPDMYGGNEGHALRIAGNCPVQMTSSMIAGTAADEIRKYIQSHHMLSKVVLFIHDSIEIDIHPSELIELSSVVIPLMNDFPDTEFGVPMKAGMVIGPSIGQEIELSDFTCNEDFSECTCIMEGSKTDIDQWYNEVGGFFEICHLEVIDSKDKYETMANLFMAKHAVSRLYGTTITEQKVKLHLKKYANT